MANSVVSGTTADVLSFFTAGGANAAGTTSKDNTAALKPAPKLENVEFSFVASERQIKVDLQELPAKIEGCYIYITAKNVKDKNGNTALPITWTVYVQQNNLKWLEPDMTLAKTVGMRETFTATIENRGSESEAWNLSGLPSWLSVSSESGVLKPLASNELTFTMAESLPTGKYEQTVYVIGNSNIAEPLTLTIKVKNEEPDWAFNAGDYEETMNVNGSLQILSIPSKDEDDIVAAFIGNECRGVARSKYNQRYDGYFVTMDIYGNGADNEKPVTFKVFDSSTGTIYPVVNTMLNNATVDVKFVSNDIIGTFKKPLVFDATDDIEQNIDLAKGWNWMSFSVKPAPMTTTTVLANADGRATRIKSKTDAAEYDAASGTWLGTLTTLNNTDMYLLNTSEAFTLNVTGQRVNPADETITVKNGWNWIGYNGLQVIGLTEALAGMSPQDGDIIKGQKGVAFFDEYEWIGSLTTLVPGQGYKVQNTTTTKTFTYPASAAYITGAQHAPKHVTMGETSSTYFEPVDYSQYPANMVLIAKVVKDGMPMPGAEIGIFAGEECREAVMADSQGMVYITIPGNAATTLTFYVVTGEGMFSVPKTLTYQTDAVVGSPRTPYVIELSEATGIQGVVMTSQQAETVYDLQGRKVQMGSQNNKLRKGVYIVNGKKQVK